MLKTRIMTAAILIPIVIGAVLYLPQAWFMGFAGLFFLLAAWEWTCLAGFKTNLSRGIAVISMPCIALLFLGLLPRHGLSFAEGISIAAMMVIFWSCAAIAVCRYPKNSWLFKSSLANILIGVLVLVPAWGALVALQAVSPKWVLYTFVLIWSADIGAYFAGKRWGKHRLAPKVSPGKSWEGVAGALIATQIVSIFGYYFLLNPTAPFVPWLLLNAITVAYSIVGDLFESVFKRQQNLKDSGTFLPGHGGILDRIDSLTAAFPIFMIGFMFFGAK